MKIMNWVEVPSAGGGSTKLPAGAYVLRITDVSEHVSRKGNPYLTIVYEIAEGEHANHFAGETRDYVHSFNKSYEDKAAPFFKEFLEALEASNMRFDIATWNKRNMDTDSYHWGDFVGLDVGVLFRDLKKEGKDYFVLDFVRAMSVDDVRAGKWTVPPAKDENEGADAQATPSGGYVANPYGQSEQPPTSVYDADVPF